MPVVKGTDRLLLLVLLGMVLAGISSGVQASDSITVTDYEGVEVEIELPVERIVSLSPPLSELVVIMGAGENIVGRNENSRFPETLKEVPVVGRTALRPQVEAILEMEPDVILADTMLTDDNRKKFERFDIPVIVERASDPDRFFTSVRNMARIFKAEGQGEELTAFIKQYEQLIEERLSDLPQEERPRVFWEWREPYQTGAEDSSVDPRISFTGGENIGRAGEGSYPVLSAEYVWEQDPEVIIQMASRTDDLEAMKESRQELMERVGLKETSAVQDGKVYIISWDIHTGLRSIIGSLYYATWFHPERFEDIDPGKVHRQFLADFYRIEEHVTVVYPDPQPEGG